MELHIYPLSIAAENRIGITNKQFDTAFPVKMKQIKGNKWTPEHQCWHIPYTKEAWQTFQQLFEGHTIIRKLSEVAKVAEPTGKLQETQPDEQAIESNTKLQETSINVQQVIELPTKQYLMSNKWIRIQQQKSLHDGVQINPTVFL